MTSDAKNSSYPSTDSFNTVVTTGQHRPAFETSRLLEFFSAKELTLQLGANQVDWPLALIKELVDNGLDNCEQHGIVPEIEIHVDGGRFVVEDNGSGIPAELVVKSLNYATRISTNAAFVAPTRGQLGNAFKCLWAAPFVADGAAGVVEVEAQGLKHRVDVRLDRIKQEPVLDLTTTTSNVKTGSRVTVYWPQLASYLDSVGDGDFYAAFDLVTNYGLFNPHANFVLARPGLEDLVMGANSEAKSKWAAGRPTSPHWYSPQSLRDLVARFLTRDAETTVRQFVAHFRGISGPLSQKKVAEQAGLPGPKLTDLVRPGDLDIDIDLVAKLLAAMKSETRPVKPAMLGLLGSHHVRGWLDWFFQLAPGGSRYEVVRGYDDDGTPFVLEVCLAISEKDCARQVVCGINFTPTLRIPFACLPEILGKHRVDPFDRVIVAVHLVSPRVQYLDRGKTQAALEASMARHLDACVASVARDWRKIKRQADKDGKAKQAAVDKVLGPRAERPRSLKEAAFAVMERAYFAASAGNTLPANARQIMYAARPLILEMTGAATMESVYFTQKLLPEFIAQNPGVCATWDVVFDDRGHLIEPHTGVSLGIGTLPVRQYIESWSDPVIPAATAPISLSGPGVLTRGGRGRFRAVLFVEKEGFMHLLRRVRLAERFDIAIMSTKGMSTTAARRLVEAFTAQNITIFAARDFDKAGFTIAHTLMNDTRRYRFSATHRIVDIGLRLEDVLAMGLQAEPVTYEGKKDPRQMLVDQGASEAEAGFLVEKWDGRAWVGKRVELNAMTATQFVAWLEQQLTRHGVTKVLPEDRVLEAAYKREVVKWQMERRINDMMKSMPDITAPPDLTDRVRSQLTGDEPWDEIVARLARQGD